MTLVNFAILAGLIFGVFVLPLILGHLLARVLGLKEMGQRMGWVFLALFLGVAPFVWQYYRGWQERVAYEEARVEWQAAMEEAEEEGEPLPDEEEPVPPTPRDWTSAIRLGIDLKGGTNLVYQVKRDELQKAAAEPGASRAAIMDRMVGAIARRINPSGTEEVTVRTVGESRIEIIMPGVDPDRVERMKSRITKLGSLEFAILASEFNERHRQLVEQARQLPPTARDVYQGDTLVASWRDVARDPRTGEFKLVSEHGQVATRVVNRGGEEVPQFLVVFESKDDRVTGQHLRRATTQSDPQTGETVVGFTFDSLGAVKFSRLTSKYQPREGRPPYRLAVLLDGQVHSAPNLLAVISAQGQISGVEGDEVEELVDVLNAGALDVPIDQAPISESTIGPTLADDVREKGLLAIAIAACAVVIFMIAYYLYAGFVADVCLILNIVLVMGAMALIEATFTLPGLAGIVLTIGMAVDANVLIFERIREELKKGSRLRMAIHNGFGRAFSAIVDANVTTLITAVVLYLIGTDQVRGFAVTLFIGIVMSMFTALYVGRLFFDVAEKKKWVTQLKMFSVVGDTNWDFLGKRNIAFVVSAVLLVGGIGALAVRGEDNLDIDFSGGIMVTFEFEEPETLEAVRTALHEEFGTGVTLERLLTLEEQQAGLDATRYRLRLKTTDVLEEGQSEAELDDTAIVELVRDRMVEAFEEGADGEEMPLRIVELENERFEVEPIPQLAEQEAADPDLAQFAGGHQVELNFSAELPTATVQNYLANTLEALSGGKYEQTGALMQFEGLAGSGLEAGPGEVQTFDRMLLRVTPDVAEEDLETALAQVRATMESAPLFEEVNSFSSAVGGEMQQSALMAMLVSILAIVGYIWFRFEQVSFGLASVVALVHDVLVVLGMVAIGAYLSNTPIGPFLGLYDFKVNLPMIAAFLTIIGYSLNDTIVVFDRIREVRGKNPALTEAMINESLNQTLSRTLLTSFTTFIVVGILYVVGGEGIHGFAFCLMVGVVVGTYSTIYVANPVLVWLNRPRGGTAPATPPADRRAAAAR